MRQCPSCVNEFVTLYTGRDYVVSEASNMYGFDYGE